jgi:ArsR family transcriptional regulator
VSTPETDACARVDTADGPATSAMSVVEAARLAPVFKALGDPVRLRMASMIAAHRELCVCDIAPAFELSSGTISHHLRLLREAGLVSCERRGTYVYYWINPQAEDAVSLLLRVGQPA